MSVQINQEQLSVPVKRKLFMSFKSKLFLSMLIAAALLIAVRGIATAQNMHGFGDDPLGMIMGRISESLDLNSSQKQHLEKIKDEIRVKMDSKKQDRENDFEEFAGEFKKGTLDKNKLNELAVKKEKDREEMRNFMLDKLVEFHAMLTPEQRNKVIEEMKNVKEKFRPGNEPGDRHDRGPGDRNPGDRNPGDKGPGDRNR